MEESNAVLFELVKKNRNIAHVIEIEDDFITVFNQKVRRVSDSMWHRHNQLQNEIDDSERSRKQGKMNTIAEFELEQNPGVWMSFDEFINKRSEKDIELIREYFSLKPASN